MMPKIPIPTDATPIARRNGGPLGVGNAVATRPKRRIPTPVMVSETHAILNRTLSRCVIVPRQPQPPIFLEYAHFAVVAQHQLECLGLGERLADFGVASDEAVLNAVACGLDPAAF